MKQLGKEPPPPVLTKPCVGKCQHRRQHGLRKQNIVRRRNPCVGLCYIAKKRAAEKRRKEEKEKSEKKNKDSI